MSDQAFGDRLIAEIPHLRAFAISLSGSMTMADDLVQETLVRAWSYADSFQPGTNFRAWVITILRNTYFTAYRKQAREVQDSDGFYAEQRTVDGDQEIKLEVKDMQKALSKLPHDYREILLLVGIAEVSYEEAAEICGVPIGTIKSRLNRARAKLAENLGLTASSAAAAPPSGERGMG
jgi:RNA polymerase sigma-70 factor (ECF subfamily)